MKNICIYHANCLDGFASAWVAYQSIPDAEFIPASYGDPLPDVAGANVYLLDFSYKRDVLLELASLADHVVVLDHHASAQRELVDMPANVSVYFDMDRAGCQITWWYFRPHSAEPAVISHVADRDLWRFKLKGTREVTAALYSRPFDFAEWEALGREGLPTLMAEGAALVRKQAQDVDAIVKGSVSQGTLAGYDVPFVNCLWFHASDVGNALAEGVPFVVCYWFDNENCVFSLRSKADGVDVSRIAELFGGGGHARAAGFKLPKDSLLHMTPYLATGGNW